MLLFIDYCSEIFRFQFFVILGELVVFLRFVKLMCQHIW
jgi:hypothetical protein